MRPRTVADSSVVESLIGRLRSVRDDSRRRWGTLTPHEMLCHLGDAAAMVRGIRPRKGSVSLRRRPLVKLLGLWSPIPWPHGWPSNPALVARAEGTRPSVFEADRTRAIEGLEGIAAAGPDALIAAHGFFGRMSTADWQRWAYKHTNHHLRQFGL